MAYSVSPDVSVLIPAHNEAQGIDACLAALLASSGPAVADVIVIANGCQDDTAARARAHAPAFAARGWALQVIEQARGHKPSALTAGDAAARGRVRVYLDADVVVSPDLLAQLRGALSRDEPRYASGTLRIARARSWATRAYRRIYAQVPFVTTGVPGAGLFAMNAAGRARWGDWPDIISDDTFARLNFAPGERQRVAAPYDWPLVEGFGALVRVRRRQNRGVTELAEHFPALLANDDKPAMPLEDAAGLIVRDPVGAVIYGGVAMATRLRANRGWERGR